MALAAAARNHHERPVFLVHAVDRHESLHKTAAAIHVRPLVGPVAAMVAVLMPAESHAVGRQLEVGLADELLHFAASQELARRRGEPRVLAVLQKDRLRRSTPDNAIDPVLIDDEVGAFDHPGPGQLDRRVAQAIESLADFPDFSVAKDAGQYDIAGVVKLLDLGFLQAKHELAVEELLHLVEPALGARVVARAILLADAFELAQKLTLALGQADRRFDHYVAEEVAGLAAAHALDALGLEAEGLAGLGLRRYADLRRAVERRDGDIAAERRGGDGDRHLAVQVVVVALEHGVRLGVHLDVEVSGRAAVHAGLAFA